MDFFQLLADLLHLWAFIVLLRQVLFTKNVLGLSYRT